MASVLAVSLLRGRGVTVCGKSHWHVGEFWRRGMRGGVVPEVLSLPLRLDSELEHIL